MSDLDQRLAQCFAIAFPGLLPANAIAATPDTVAEWDSVGAINLASLIGEEFGVAIDFERLPDLTSFAAFRDLVTELTTKDRSS